MISASRDHKRREWKRKCSGMRYERFFARRREIHSCRKGIVQGLLRLRFVKPEESPRCGGGEPAGYGGGSSHEICKQIANSQTVRGHGRLRRWDASGTQLSPALTATDPGNVHATGNSIARPNTRCDGRSKGVSSKT